jgi:hypothetical protein
MAYTLFIDCLTTVSACVALVPSTPGTQATQAQRVRVPLVAALLSLNTSEGSTSAWTDSDKCRRLQNPQQFRQMATDSEISSNEALT